MPLTSATPTVRRGPAHRELVQPPDILPSILEFLGVGRCPRPCRPSRSGRCAGRGAAPPTPMPSPGAYPLGTMSALPPRTLTGGGPDPVAKRLTSPTRMVVHCAPVSVAVAPVHLGARPRPARKRHRRLSTVAERMHTRAGLYAGRWARRRAMLKFAQSERRVRAPRVCLSRPEKEPTTHQNK